MTSQKPVRRYVELCQVAMGLARGKGSDEPTQSDAPPIENVSTQDILARATYHGEPPRFVGLRYSSREAARRGDNARDGKAPDGVAFDESPQEHLAALQAHAALIYPKHHGPVWVYGRSKNGGRGDVDATQLTTLFLDADGVGDWHVLLNALARAKLTFIAQRSGGHSDDKPKWHVAIPIVTIDVPRFRSGLPDKATWQTAYAWVAGLLSHLAGFTPTTHAAEPPPDSATSPTNTATSPHFDLAIAQAFLHVVYPGARRTEDAAPPETFLHEGGILDLTALLRLSGFHDHMAKIVMGAPTNGDDHGPSPGQGDTPQSLPQSGLGTIYGYTPPVQEPSRQFTPAEYAEGRKRAAAYAARLTPSRSEHGGDAALWEAALKVRRGFPLAPTVNEANRHAATILLKHFNPRCVDRDGKTPYPWPVETIERKVREAASAHLGGKSDYWLFDEPSRNDLAAMKTPTDRNKAEQSQSVKPASEASADRPVASEPAKEPTKEPALKVIRGGKGKPGGGDGGENNEGWTSKLIYKNKHELKPIVRNAVLILSNDSRWKDVISFDEMAGYIEKTIAPHWTDESMPTTIEDLVGKWTDGDIIRLQDWFSSNWDLHISKEVAADAVIVVAEKRKHNKVRDYLKSLSWDGVPRVATWLTTYLGVASSPYSKMVGQMWLISAVARIFQPGCMAKYSLVLEGPQDIGKSKATRILGGAWWRDMSLTVLKDKDAYIGIRGRWIIELAELDGLNKHESSRIKHYLSQVKDDYRPPYGRSDITVPRCNVFVGTVNPDSSRGYLNDPTGNVRFWPVFCTLVDEHGLARDRDQLWAEAVALYHSGTRWWPETREENALCHVEQEQRSATDDREAIVAHWLGSSQAKELEAERGIFPIDVMHHALGLNHIEKMDRRVQTDVGNIMGKLGWVGDQKSGKQYCKICTAPKGVSDTCGCGSTKFYRPKIYRRS